MRAILPLKVQVMRIEKLDRRDHFNSNNKSGPILESKGMRAIFQKKGKKEQNIWKFEQKYTKFENILKKSR